MHLIFVYGTLLRGERNAHHLRDSHFIAESATDAGYELVNMGRYPAVIEGGATSIAGEVYEVNDATLKRLDRLEDHPDYYQRVPITLCCGREVEFYLLPRIFAKDRAVIASGDYRKR